MYVKQLRLKNYRNYETLELNFDQGIHLFIGDNAQGKTNLLEAIYVLSLARSYRTTRDRELIQWGERQAVLTAEIEKKYGSINLALYLSNQGKKAKLNYLEQQRLSQYVGSFNVVIFAPEDLDLIKGSPQLRRRFIDLELGQISPSYLQQLARYQKVLGQRNALLKENKDGDEAMYHIFTQQLIEEAVPIYLKRFQFVKQLSQWAGEIHADISQGKEKLEIAYQPSSPVTETMDKAELTAVLNRSYAQVKHKEERQGNTLLGPHRDDLILSVNGRHVHAYGSQGQQRTAALALKLAEIELIKAEKGEYPVLLLDDVLSELDDSRRTHLLKTIKGKVQTFVTSTDSDGIDRDLLQQATIYRVNGGRIEQVMGKENLSESSDH